MLKATLVIPALNEAQNLTATLKRMQQMRKRGQQVILVDGGSSDKTVEIARSFGVRTMPSPPGRTKQMNSGAAAATGEVLHIFEGHR